VEASPVQNADIFNGVIGGYGGLGVITEATIALTDNVKVKRQAKTMPIGEYRRYFINHVRASSATVLHNADIYPDAYDAVNSVTYEKTDDPLTNADRLIPENDSYALNRFVYWVVSEWPFGKAIRRHVVDPILFRGEPVTWRNYEASYDARELEPASRASSTCVLEEYFVPVDSSDFVPGCARCSGAVCQRHQRLRPICQTGSGSLLAWARTEVFAFVIYYKQGTSAAAQTEVGLDRELIDAP
jgi:FAD/FMN-containing dehydrogenase